MNGSTDLEGVPDSITALDLPAPSGLMPRPAPRVEAPPQHLTCPPSFGDTSSPRTSHASSSRGRTQQGRLQIRTSSLLESNLLRAAQEPLPAP